MKAKLLLFFCVLTTVTYGQEPVNNYFSSPMSNYFIVSGTIDQSSTGANAVWNFNTLTQTANNTDTFAAPTAAELVDYPGTTQVLTITDNAMNTNVVFYKLDGVTLSLTGANNSDFNINYNADNALIGAYPLTYGNPSTTDAIAGTITTQGQTATFTGTFTTEVDAYGILGFDVVGEGSFSGGVTRVKTEQMISFTALGIYPGTAEITSYNYYKDSDGALVFRTSDAIINIAGLGINQTTSSSEALITNTLSVTNNGLAINSVKIYPNPVEDFLNIKLDDEVSVRSVEIKDINGRTVLFSQRKIDNMDVSHLQTGFYLVIIFTKNSSITRRKFVKK